MAGIYLHIPFCKQACRYCDFYFTVSLKYQDVFTKSLVDEMRARKDFAGRSIQESLYLGGGTPSVLSRENLEKIMRAARSLYSFRPEAEITIEANPDDLDAEKLALLRDLGFNRLSIGVQSFRQQELELMRRSHNAAKATASVELATRKGFRNISIDLIYGIPGQEAVHWEENLLRGLALPVQHLSAYHLSFESGTVFDHWRRKGRIKPVDEALSLRMYQILREKTAEAGFEHYEISNFARPGMRSGHNGLYWSGAAYLGLGPSAHSFDGQARSWNPSDLKRYMQDISEGRIGGEKEVPGLSEAYHDYLLTSLRTREGADPQWIARAYGEEISDHFQRQSRVMLQKALMKDQQGRLIIKPEHWLVADGILRDLFLES